MRCKHKNGIFYEVMEANHAREVNNGTMNKSGLNHMNDIIRYDYHCHDCDKWFRLRYPPERNPRWLQKIYMQL